MSNEYFGVVRWHKDDIAIALKEENLPATESNIQKVYDRLSSHWFTDFLIERGWEYIRNTIWMLDEEMNRDE